MKVKLDDIEKIKLPYQVPVGYFDRLELSIQEKVSTSPSKLAITNWAWATVPAFVVILIASIWLINGNVGTQSVSDLLAEIPEDEIMAYLAYEEISEQEILSLSDWSLLQDYESLEAIEINEADLDDLIDSFELDNLDLNDI